MVGFVAVGGALVLVEVLVGTVELVVVVVLLEVVVELLVDVDGLVELLELLQSLAASSATVLAPWLRFCEGWC